MLQSRSLSAPPNLDIFVVVRFGATSRPPWSVRRLSASAEERMPAAGAQGRPHGPQSGRRRQWSRRNLSSGAVVGGASLGLAPSAPPGPVGGVVEVGSWRAGEGVEQAAEFGRDQRDQLAGCRCGALVPAVARVTDRWTWGSIARVLPAFCGRRVRTDDAGRAGAAGFADPHAHRPGARSAGQHAPGGRLLEHVKPRLARDPPNPLYLLARVRPTDGRGGPCQCP
jgi:hypothetical protein